MKHHFFIYVMYVCMLGVFFTGYAVGILLESSGFHTSTCVSGLEKQGIIF